jgi:hypothetical protein
MWINRYISYQPVEDINGSTPFRGTGVMLLVIMEEAFIGRLMLFTLNSPFASLTNALILGGIEILFRSSASRRVRTMEFIKDKLGNWIQHWFGKEMNPKDFTFLMEIQATKSHYGMSVQNMALFVTAAMLGALYRSRLVFDLSYSTFDPLDYGSFALLLFIQLCVNIVVDLICLISETLQGLTTTRIVYIEPVRMALWEVACAIVTFTVVLYVMGSLPFAGYCDSKDPCTCRIGIDFRLYSTLCENSTIRPIID